MSSQNLSAQSFGTGVAEELSKLKEGITLSDLERGTLLYVPGDTADRLFFLISGRVKISAPSRDGKQCILQVVEPGQIFGESMLFGHGRRQTTAEVIEKASVTVIPGEAAAAFAESHPEFWKSYSQQLGDRVRDIEEQVRMRNRIDVESNRAGQAEPPRDIAVTTSTGHTVVDPNELIAQPDVQAFLRKLAAAKKSGTPIRNSSRQR